MIVLDSSAMLRAALQALGVQAKLSGRGVKFRIDAVSIEPAPGQMRIKFSVSGKEVWTQLVPWKVGQVVNLTNIDLRIALEPG